MWGDRREEAGLGDQGVVDIPTGFGTVMFDTFSPVLAQVVESETVLVDAGFFEQAVFAFGPLSRIERQFKYTVLYSLAIVQAGLGDTTKTSATLGIGGGHILGHENVHGNLPKENTGLTPEEWWVLVEVAPQMTSQKSGL